MELKTTRYDLDERRPPPLQLSRPQKRRNAWTGRMHTEYRWCLAQANDDPAVRVIVVTGDPEGQAFCAGADLGALEGHAEKGRYDAGTPEDIATPGFPASTPASTRPSPTCFRPRQAGHRRHQRGGGRRIGLVLLAAYADLRFAAAGAEVHRRARPLQLSRGLRACVVDPAAAGRRHPRQRHPALQPGVHRRGGAGHGLPQQGPPVGRSAPARSSTTPRTLARNVSPGAARATKHQIYRDLHGDAATAVQESERLLEEMIRHPDYGEGVKAWMEKRVALWRG